jgi:hypothetical protein
VLVLIDSALREAGLDAATAIALLAPSQDQLVVHVRTLDGLPAHRSGLDDVHQPPDGTAFTSPVITEAAPAVEPADKVFHGEASVLHGGHDVRQSSEWKNGHLNTLPTIKPTIDDEPAALPIGSRRRSSLTPSHDGLNRQLDVPPPAILNPPVSDEYRRRQQINDNAPIYTPRSEPPPGHTTAAMLEALALPGESAADAVARRQREAQAQVEAGPVVVYPRLGGYTSHRLD